MVSDSQCSALVNSFLLPLGRQGASPRGVLKMQFRSTRYVTIHAKFSPNDVPPVTSHQESDFRSSSALQISQTFSKIETMRRGGACGAQSLVRGPQPTWCLSLDAVHGTQSWLSWPAFQHQPMCNPLRNRNRDRLAPSVCWSSFQGAKCQVPDKIRDCALAARMAVPWMPRQWQESFCSVA